MDYGLRRWRRFWGVLTVASGSLFVLGANSDNVWMAGAFGAALLIALVALINVDGYT